MDKGQTAVYIILAIILVVGIIFFVVYRTAIQGEKTSEGDFTPVFEYYDSCIESEGRTAIQLIGSQGGRIEVPAYVPGSDYAPFSNHLNFLGFPVPYWYYVSGSGIIRENVPTLQNMEQEMSRFIAEGLVNCDLEQFKLQGMEASASEPIVKVTIRDTKVYIDVSSKVRVQREGNAAEKVVHRIELNSKLGRFYTVARTIYKEERDNAFFENYAQDVLYLYAPVTGTELQCGPKIWQTQQVIDDLKTGLESNFQTIKFKGSYYSLRNDTRKYFVVNIPSDENVNVIYSKQWPTKVEIQGDNVDEAIMRADPVGTQPGLGAMGFCYVPYHFVYDLSFPVIVQVFNSDEMFQFPVVVVIDKNVPRQANLTSSLISSTEQDFDLCAFMNQDIDVSVTDVNMEPVDANITYECFNQQCRLGQTRNGQFSGRAPACVNGYIQVSAGGYATQKQIFSTNKETSADIVLEREYDISLNVSVGGKPLKGTAIISFMRDDGEKSASVALPFYNTVTLSEGIYEVRVYVYDNSTITIPASSKQQCINKPKDGLMGFFGATEEECFDITIPETKLDNVIIGGGVSTEYLLASELAKGKAILKVSEFPRPNSLEQMQENFERFDVNPVEVVFK